MRKTTSKKLLDIILLCLFFAELGGMFLPHPVHEVLGCLFIALVVLHNIKNRYFYEHFLSGTYPPLRLANNISIILFAVSLVLSPSRELCCPGICFHGSGWKIHGTGAPFI